VLKHPRTPPVAVIGGGAVFAVIVIESMAEQMVPPAEAVTLRIINPGAVAVYVFPVPRICPAASFHNLVPGEGVEDNGIEVIAHVN
jgi:hypothetical protein